MTFPRTVRIDAALIRRWPLPMPPADGNKEDRGRVLVVAAARDVPGAAILAGVAALRAGAGKLCIAAAAPAVTAIGTLVPECRAVPYTPAAVAGLLRDHFDTILVGPGMGPSAGLAAFVRRLHRAHPATLVLDAGALAALREGPFPGRGATRCVITPHAGEMAKLADMDKADVEAHGRQTALCAAQTLRVVVVLKGSTTWIADPEGHSWRHEARTIGLATSGSGDTLAGLVAGLAARGASPAQAAVHGVFLHARAGARAARRQGPLGALARELAPEVPALLAGD